MQFVTLLFKHMHFGKFGRKCKSLQGDEDVLWWCYFLSLVFIIIVAVVDLRLFVCKCLLYKRENPRQFSAGIRSLPTSPPSLLWLQQSIIKLQHCQPLRFSEVASHNTKLHHKPLDRPHPNCCLQPTRISLGWSLQRSRKWT